MTQAPRRPLSVRDVGALLDRSPQARDAILVGGQALNIWAVRFGLAGEHAVVSDDIDFFAHRHVAVQAGLDWGAQIHGASFDDHTPNSAVVIIEIDNVEHNIDFLDQVMGVDSAELRRWASLIRGRDYHFRVMHPLHVLQSHVENLYGILNRREHEGGDYYVERLKLAVQVARAAILEMLRAARGRESLRAAERVADVAQRPPALEAWRRDAVDVLAAVRHDNPAWPEKFRATRWPQILELVGDTRMAYAKRKERARKGK